MSVISNWVCVLLPYFLIFQTDLVLTGRESYLFPVHWEDGWPIINNGKPLVENDPDVLLDDKPLQLFSTNFTEGSLDATFHFLRTPIKKFHEITEDGLFIHANSYALGDRDNPAAVFRRQSSYSETFEVQVDFQDPHNRLQEAGISAFYDDYLHNEVGFTGASDGSGDRYVIARTIVQAVPVPPWPLTPENNTVITVRGRFSESLRAGHGLAYIFLIDSFFQAELDYLPCQIANYRQARPLYSFVRRSTRFRVRRCGHLRRRRIERSSAWVRYLRKLEFSLS